MNYTDTKVTKNDATVKRIEKKNINKNRKQQQSGWKDRNRWTLLFSICMYISIYCTNLVNTFYVYICDNASGRQLNKPFFRFHSGALSPPICNIPNLYTVRFFCLFLLLFWFLLLFVKIWIWFELYHYLAQSVVSFSIAGGFLLYLICFCIGRMFCFVYCCDIAVLVFSHSFLFTSIHFSSSNFNIRRIQYKHMYIQCNLLNLNNIRVTFRSQFI